MTSIFILYTWTIVGFAGAKYSSVEATWERYDWRVQGEFYNEDLCKTAAQKLGLSKWKCIDT